MKKWISRLLIIIIGLPLLLVLVAGAAFLISNRTNGTLESSGETRRYLLYVPESYDPSTPTPLVICIHGFAQWPAHQMQISGWQELADEHGFIVVCPMGTGFPLRWRAYGAPGSKSDPLIEVDFISALIDKLSAEYNIDPQRLYANGLSNGGGMSFALACMLSERIAAVGLVGGAYLLPWEQCKPGRPVPAVVFHGTADEIVPYQGGPSHSFELPFPAIPDFVDRLAEHNDCTGETVALPANGEVSGVEFTDCAAEVVFYTIAGGGHSWPGGVPIPEWLVGPTTMDIDATQVMWEFFERHPMGEAGE
jgi:polyhydroxybutyrate depolymerase